MRGEEKNEICRIKWQQDTKDVLRSPFSPSSVSGFFAV